MPCIAGRFHHETGPLLQVAIVANISEELAKGETADEPNLFMGLIDTGATTTCISEKVVKGCGLEPTGKTLMTGATGTEEVDQFTFGVGFLVAESQMPTGYVQGVVSVIPVQGCQFENHGTIFDVLIGRDIISKGSFSLSFDGHYIFCI